MKMNSALFSNVVMFAGIATTILLMICLPVVFVQFPIWLALIVGIATGVPLLVVGFLLHPESVKSRNSDAPFLPTQDDILGFGWASIAFCTIMAFSIAPLGILGALLLLPPGDSWPIAVSRLVIVIFALCSAIAWWSWWPAAKFAKWLFRDKVSDSFLNGSTGKQSPKPTNFVTATIKKWEIDALASAAVCVAIAAAAFCFAFGVIDLKQPWMERPVGRGKYRWILEMLVWLASHPNTAKAFAWSVCFASVVAFFGVMMEVRNRKTPDVI